MNWTFDPLGGVLTAAVAAAVLYLYRQRRQRALPSLPPGPPPYPIIGNWYDMPRSRQALTFTEWGKIYGPIVYVSVFGRSTLILNTYQVARDVLDKRGQIYSDRPRLSTGKVLRASETGTVFAPFGPTWRKHRRFLNQVLNPSNVRRDYSSLQTRKTLEYILTLLDRPDDFFASIRRMTGEAVSQFAYGAYHNDERDFIDMNDEISLLNRNKPPGGVLSAVVLEFQSWLPSWLLQKTSQRRDLALQHDVYEATRAYLFDWVKSQKENNITAPPSYVMTMLKNTENSSTKEDDHNVICGSAFSFLRAGGDTTEVALKSLILALTLNPHVQTLAHAEIDRVIGSDRLPTLDDQDDLPYITAIVLETLRWNPPTATGIPHKLTEDDIFNGYHIPAGTSVLANMWAMSRDPTLFTSPSTFDPSRYLASPPPLDPRDFVLGFGRRVCPGGPLAYQGLWISAAMLLASFTFEKKRDSKGVVIEPVCEFALGFNSEPAPYVCDIKPRHPHIREQVDRVLSSLPTTLGDS
ncbi:hypothetical protein FRB99_000242 [Tulasnella sp. 403]|nr:hypothetical protein FRB99_000242 [Tulasnella sp. 403]